MKTEKAVVEKITSCFDLKCAIEFKPGLWQSQILSFRGLVLPGPRSKQGRALSKHLTKVVRSVPFLAIRKYGKNAFVRHETDFFYLPGEDNPRRVAEGGRCLNKELLDLGLAKPYDENKRKINFSKRRIRVYDQDIDLVTGNFKAEVGMYINDCKQYLRAALENRPAAAGLAGFVKGGSP